VTAVNAVVPTHSDVELEDGSRLPLPTRALRRTTEPFQKKKRTTWLAPGIRVKIVKQEHDHYRRKATVLDVEADNCARLRLDDNTVLSKVRQKDLQTVLPKPGGRLLVVLGAHAGKRGTLLKKQSDEKAVVHLDDDFDDDRSITLSFDDVAELSSSRRQL